jgi:hypothetical protein
LVSELLDSYTLNSGFILSTILPGVLTWTFPLLNLMTWLSAVITLNLDWARTGWDGLASGY